VNYTEHKIPIEVSTLEKQKPKVFLSVGEGTLPVMLQFRNTKTILMLKHVQVVPDAHSNILSVNQFNVQFKTSCVLNCTSGFLTSRQQKVKLAAIKVEGGVYQVTGRILSKTLENKKVTVYSTCISDLES